MSDRILQYNDFLKLCEKEGNSVPKKKLLLHSCCGPCSSHTLEVLLPYFDITVYYYNPNMDTLEEYTKRANTQEQLIQEMNEKGAHIGFICEEYHTEEYYQAIKGYEHLKEGSMRCFKCYEFRMRKTMEKARELGFDYFTTTLSISPYKNEKWINEIGYNLDEKRYLYSNFKKENGYQKSIQLSKEFNLYRQHYCGCIYSKNEWIEKCKEKESILDKEKNV